MAHWMVQAAIAVAVAIVLIGLLLFWRVRKSRTAAGQPKKGQPCCKDASEPLPKPKRPRSLRQRIEGMLDALDYLSTRREWHYRTPWILSIGEHDAGKSSLPRSVSPGLRQRQDSRQDELQIEGASWHFFEKGVLIDPDGRLPVGSIGSEAGLAWDQMLDSIDALRPERPIDGLLLSISARTLLSASAEERHALAKNMLHQLDTIQTRFEFMLPVYVVITESDTIDGFSAFWNELPAGRQQEIFGWSAPASAVNGSPQDWADNAFETINDRLRALQVNAAARVESIADPDRFFLFPRHFRQLHTPLADLLTIVFHASPWRAGFLCRGLYFTGSLVANGAIEAKPRHDIAFVDELFMQKVLAEPLLATPTRQGIWSRNRLIRALQIAGVTSFCTLLVVLGLSSMRLHRQVEALTTSIKMVRAVSPSTADGDGCISRERVYALLNEIALVDNNTFYWAIPASAVDWRASHRSAAMIADAAFTRVIMPGIACRLALRARTLAEQTPRLPLRDYAGADAWQSTRTVLFTRLQAVQDLEKNLDRFHRLATQEPQPSAEKPLQQFFALTEYAYDSPLPPSIRRQRGALEDALIDVSYTTEVSLPSGMRAEFTRQIEQFSTFFRRHFDQEVLAGSMLVGQLTTQREPILDNTRHFTWWLNWISKSWLDSTPEKNPCEQARTELMNGIDALVSKYGYPVTLSRTGQQFDANTCYKPAMNKLLSMQLPPYGPLFKQQGTILELNQALIPELNGLTALAALNYMRLPDTGTFSCRGAMSGWDSALISQAAAYVREYQAFAKARGLPVAGAGKQPLYDQLAQHQLETAMGAALRDAQMPSAAFADSTMGLDATSQADRQLSQQSKAFAGVLEPLQGVFKSYQQYGFVSGQQITQCIRNFAADNLASASTLAVVSRLYEPQAGDADGLFYDLGVTAVTKDYLARQVARSQVLADYAKPFVTFLQDSTAINDAQKTNDQTAPYWSNTISELNRYVQFKEPNGQVAQLDTLFLKQLPDMDATNCSKNAYVPVEYGNDLFSSRRKQIDESVRWRCDNLRDVESLAAYRDLSQRFTRELSGRYPFGDPGNRDASLSAVRDFFADYENQRAVAIQLVSSLSAPQRAVVQDWFDQLDAVAAFFKGNLNAAAPGQPVQLDVTFNIPTPTSYGAEQIVSWNIASGGRAIGYPNRANKLEWSYGRPLALDLEWANRSKLLPARDVQQADLGIDGATATFTASGDWALLRLVQTHRPRSGATTDTLDPSRLLLELRVPVMPEQSPAGAAPSELARLYLGLNLAAKDPKTQNWLPLTLPPIFPRFAPNYEEFVWTPKSRH